MRTSDTWESIGWVFLSTFLIWERRFVRWIGRIEWIKWIRQRVSLILDPSDLFVCVHFANMRETLCLPQIGKCQCPSPKATQPTKEAPLATKHSKWTSANNTLRIDIDCTRQVRSMGIVHICRVCSTLLYGEYVIIPLPRQNCKKKRCKKRTLCHAIIFFPPWQAHYELV